MGERREGDGKGREVQSSSASTHTGTHTHTHTLSLSLPLSTPLYPFSSPPPPVCHSFVVVRSLLGCALWSSWRGCSQTWCGLLS